MTGDVRRRDLLAVGSLGITSSLLPTAVAAASVDGVVAAVPSAPTIASAEPAGYLLSAPQVGTSTGAIEVSWGEVAGATSYAVSTRTPSGSGDYVLFGATSATTLTVTGLTESATYDVVVEASNAVGASSPSAPATAVRTVVATGGTVTSFVADGTNGTSGTRYVVHTFTTVGTSSLTLIRAQSLEYLVVGGGGGGGRGTNTAHGGGGGGAGGYRCSVPGELTGGGLQAESAFSAGAGTLDVIVGAGGAGGVGTTAAGAGAASRLGPLTGGVTADGGGRGSSYPADRGATSGGSGGGGAPTDTRDIGTPLQRFGAAATASPVQGHAGGDADDWRYANAGAGGGGAGGSGGSTTGAENINGLHPGGAGGVGLTSSITGAPVARGGGGGGAGGSAGGVGVAGGGAGGIAAPAGGTTGGGGDTGTGGGGGGGGASTALSAAGGSGGSGIVIVRYAVPT